MSHPSQEDIISELSYALDVFSAHGSGCIDTECLRQVLRNAMAEIGRLEQEKSTLSGDLTQLLQSRNRLQSANQRLLDRLDTQRQSIETIRAERDQLQSQVDNQADAIDTLMAERDRYREALEVYADRGNWLLSKYGTVRPLQSDFRLPDSLIHREEGSLHPHGYEIAQRALEGVGTIYSQTPGPAPKFDAENYGVVAMDAPECCENCGSPLEKVRPGKTQCPNCAPCPTCGEVYNAEIFGDCPECIRRAIEDTGAREYVFGLTCDVCGGEYTTDNPACFCNEIQRAEDEEAEWIGQRRHSTQSGYEPTQVGYDLGDDERGILVSINRRGARMLLDAIEDWERAEANFRYDFDGSPIGYHPLAHIAIQIQDERGGEG